MVTYRGHFESSVFTHYNLLGKIIQGGGGEGDEISDKSPLQVDHLFC